jgi:spermidine synthase
MESNLNLWLHDLFNGETGITMRVRDCLHSSTSPFQRLAVYDTEAFGRVLTLGGSIALTEKDEPVYSELLVHPALAVDGDPRRVLILGGGDGGVAREVLRYPNIEQVTVVEIDRQVVEVCAKHFPASAIGLRDPRIKLIYDDAHRWLRANQERYDVVIIDGCELINAPSEAFYQETFASAVMRALDEDGILVAPLGDPDFETDLCRGTMRVLTERFPTPHVYQMSMPSLPGGEWAVAWCSAKRTPFNVTREPTGAATLQCWHKDLQPALFALPRQVQRLLGLG